MQARKVLPFVLLLALLLMPFADAARAVSARSAQPIIPPQEGTPPASPPVSIGADPTPAKDSASPQSLSGSYVVFDPSIGGSATYLPGASQTLCFRSESFTTDYEYAYSNWLKFPDTWNVSTVYVEGTPVCDSGASWGTFGWSYQTSPYEVRINHTRLQANTDHCVANYCVEVTPSFAGDPAQVSWYFDGDGYGGGPHNPCSSDNYNPAGQSACDESTNLPASIPTEATGLFFSPERIDSAGCHGEPQEHAVKLYNRTGATATITLEYFADFGGTFTGPQGFIIPDGEYASFFVTLDPHVCTDDREIYGVIEATCGGGETALFEIHKQIYSEAAEWQQLATNPAVTMDNVLAAYSGKLWQITGYGTTGVSNYDPLTDAWTAIPASAPPFGQNYARSGCQYENKVFMYGDSTTPGFTGLWSYDMDTNVWTAETPSGTPPPLTGIWAPAWVSDPVTHICFMTGGSNTPGTGTLTSVYGFDPLFDSWLPSMPSFTTPRDFHAAFIFERPADNHKLLCVAGGNSADLGLTSTQCYDFTAAMWYPENADLGVLPASLWGMGYATLTADAGDDLWLVNGIDAAYAIANVTWRLNTATGGWEDLGPLPGGAVYRLSAAVLDNTLYQSGGSTGGFSPSGLTHKFLVEVCEACVLPDVVKEATAVALPGETIDYTITVPQIYNDTIQIFDTLPEGTSFVPGSLTVWPDIGNYGYIPSASMVYWFYEPAPLKAAEWTPVEIAGAAGEVDLQISGKTSAAAQTPNAPARDVNAVLWDQPISTVNTDTYVDQEFEDYPAYSSFLADDFIADSPWTIDSFFVPGNGWNGFTTLLNASQVTFMIFADDMGVPAGDPAGRGDPPLWVETMLPTDPSLTITTGAGGYPSDVLFELDTPILLPSGHYWFIFYPTLNFTSYGQFGRQASDTANGYTAQFVNPGGGFGYGTEWQPWTVIGPTQTDVAFSIYGSANQSVEISFQAEVLAPRRDVLNTAYLIYGDRLIWSQAVTFTGHPVYLPITMKQ